MTRDDGDDWNDRVNGMTSEDWDEKNDQTGVTGMIRMNRDDSKDWDD